MMTKIVEITKPHALAFGEACKRAEEVAKAMADPDPKKGFGIKWEWKGSTIHFVGSGLSGGVKGFLAVQKQSVRLRIELPLLLWAVEGTVRSKANEYLKALDTSRPAASA